MSYRVESLLIVLCALITLNAQAVSFTADAVQLRDSDISQASMMTIAADGGSVQAIQWYDSALDFIVKQQAEDGAIDELHNIKVENIKPEMFAISEGYRPVESQLTELNPESAMTFGTADQQ